MTWPNLAGICRRTRTRSIADGCRHQAKQRAEAAAVTKGCAGCGTGCAPQTVHQTCRTAKLAMGRRCWQPKSVGRSDRRHSEAQYAVTMELVDSRWH